MQLKTLHNTRTQVRELSGKRFWNFEYIHTSLTKHWPVSEVLSSTLYGTRCSRRTYRVQEYFPPSFMSISLRTNEVDSFVASMRESVRFFPSLVHQKPFSVAFWLPLNDTLQNIVVVTEWSTSFSLETVTLGLSFSERERIFESTFRLSAVSSKCKSIATANGSPEDNVTMNQWAAQCIKKRAAFLLPKGKWF